MDNSSTAQYVAGYDGKGNLTVLIDAINNVNPTANIKLQIEYGPYGEILSSKGDLSLTPLRYQTKWSLDSKTAARPLSVFTTLAVGITPLASAQVDARGFFTQN